MGSLFFISNTPGNVSRIRRASIPGQKNRGQNATGKKNRAGKASTPTRTSQVPSVIGDPETTSMSRVEPVCPARGPRQNLQKKLGRESRRLEFVFLLSSIHPCARIQDRGRHVRGTHFDGWLWWSVSDVEERKKECGWASCGIFSSLWLPPWLWLGILLTQKKKPSKFSLDRKIFCGDVVRRPTTQIAGAAQFFRLGSGLVILHYIQRVLPHPTAREKPTRQPLVCRQTTKVAGCFWCLVSNLEIPSFSTVSLIQNQSKWPPARRLPAPPRRTSPSAPPSAMVCNCLFVPKRNRKHASSSHSKIWAMKTNDGIFAGELVFGVARIFASFNDTFVHITDLRFVPTDMLSETRYPALNFVEEGHGQMSMKITGC